MRIAAIGECMIELREQADGTFARSFGGDTLNTAVYLARLGVDVDYVTALGDDAWSDEMISAWQSEGVGTSQVVRKTGRLPGLYVIQTDKHGERRFSYWRGQSPARDIFNGDEQRDFSNYDFIYLSGITLSLYGEQGRMNLFSILKNAAANGAKIIFDTNYRPRNWATLNESQTAFAKIYALTDLLFASSQDLDLLYGQSDRSTLRNILPNAEIIYKCADPACWVMTASDEILVHAKSIANVVDTTAAGDSFAAAYIAVRINGASAEDSAIAGHRLAGQVVQFPGAIIPRDKMPRAE